jgi:hypothetical protein
MSAKGGFHSIKIGVFMFTILDKALNINFIPKKIAFLKIKTDICYINAKKTPILQHYFL